MGDFLKRVSVAGSLALKAHQGGHTWQFLQYLLGFRRLGWDVFFLDRLDPDMCFDESGRPCSIDMSANLAYLRAVMSRFGLADSWAVVADRGSRWVGMPKERAIERIQGSLLLNVMGYTHDEDALAAAETRVFIDTDPGFGQMWRELGLADVFDRHDAYVTIAENMGRPDCGIPTAGIPWHTSPQPVVLDEWRAPETAPSGRFTSIGAWRGPYGPIEFHGETYGQRVHEFRRFFDLPRHVAVDFEAALDVQEGDEGDLRALSERGWILVSPRDVAHDPDVYRRYIQMSKAEFMVARGMYVKTRSGWFSERSMCYLASGRPVLAQDTGIRDLYPTGEGLLAFSTLDEAVQGVEAICGDYARHSQVAQEIAREYFDSTKVLPRLLAKLGVD